MEMWPTQGNEPDMFTDYEDLRLPVKAAQNSEGPSMSASYTEAASVAATLLDARQVAQLLHVSESWVREHSNGKEPRLPAMKLGQGKTALVRFHMNDIEDFIRNQRELARRRTVLQKRW
jgi:hypothetical protein